MQLAIFHSCTYLERNYVSVVQHIYSLDLGVHLFFHLINLFGTKETLSPCIILYYY
jgi:hypothetical protein